MNNREVMERFGFRICSECNADMPADGFVGDLCRYCSAEQRAARFTWSEGDIVVTPESSYDRVRRGIEEHDAWKRERNQP
jgi:ribosomal protein L40E